MAIFRNNFNFREPVQVQLFNFFLNSNIYSYKIQQTKTSKKPKFSCATNKLNALNLQMA